MGKLLIIEDDFNFIRIYRNTFDSVREIKFFDEGEFGFKVAKLWQPDLVILDVQLKGKMTGMEVLRMMKEDKETKNISVMMVTIADLLKEKSLNLGADEFFYKLEAEIHQIFNSAKQYLSQASGKLR